MMKQKNKLQNGRHTKKVIYLLGKDLFLVSLLFFFTAGVRGTVKGLIGSFMDYDISGQPKSNVWFFELEVKHILNEWPESDFRQRKWVKIIYTSICRSSILKKKNCYYSVH